MERVRKWSRADSVDLGEDFSIEIAVVVGELYRNNGEWKFNAIGSAFPVV